MKVVTFKFGGSSVASIEKIQKVAERICKKVDEGYHVVVIASAMGKSTDALIDMAHQITDRPNPREMDMLVSTGEQVTVALLCITLNHLGKKAVSLTGGQVGVRADNKFMKGKIQEISTKRLDLELSRNDVVAVAGFQGVDEEGNIVTLGRGGSDLSAVALATVVKAETCQIFTDVDGIYTADPRVVSNAKKLDLISFDEMLELASAGAGVMQARSIEFAKKYNVPIVVRAAFNDTPGTLIKEEDDSMEGVSVRGIAQDVKQVKVTVRGVPDQPGIAAALFNKLADNSVIVDMIIQNQSLDKKTDISFTVLQDDEIRAVDLTEEVVKKMGVEKVVADKVAMVTIVGVGMKTHSGVAAKMFDAMAEKGINIDMISTSEIKISIVIDRARGEEAVQTLHAAFIA